MYLMYADEADQDGTKEYLVFAGVFFPADSLLGLHATVSGLRTKYGFAEADSLKSGAGTRPKNVSPENHRDIKNDILSEAAKAGCKACCYIVPHSIARSQLLENKLKFGVNTLLSQFDRFLRENGGVAGTASFDRSNDYKQDKYLKEVFEQGVPFGSGKRTKLGNVVSVGVTQNGTSHLASITDIVVGSFRFVINEPDKDRVGSTLLKALGKLVWGEVGTDGILRPRERGFCIRPQSIRNPAYQADIDALIERLNQYATK